MHLDQPFDLSCLIVHKYVMGRRYDCEVTVSFNCGCLYTGIHKMSVFRFRSQVFESRLKILKMHPPYYIKHVCGEQDHLIGFIFFLFCDMILLKNQLMIYVEISVDGSLPWCTILLVANIVAEGQRFVVN